ncbi:MAG TPA: ABC transporter substrate-binding protein [Clostridia bacterium]|nr:ABC transporter substrate-binding protein [Clostridia bacterium]
MYRARGTSRRSRTSVVMMLLLAACFATSCSRKPEANTAVMIIESSPTNLDPRVGTDAQSERIGKLVFDALLHRNEKFEVEPWLAERWEVPDPLTYVFHLRHDVRFHDGRQMTSADVKWTFDSILLGKIRTPKASTYRFVERVDAPDNWTIVFHMKEPYASLPWNLSDGAIGIVPNGSGDEITRSPIGTGPFKLASMEQDRQVTIERNPHYWGTKTKLERVRFIVVPDATTRALELRKGSADVAINALTADMVLTLEKDNGLVVQRSPGTIYTYLALNLRDPILQDRRVRQALAFAVDRRPMIHYLWRDMARPAASVLPTQHWAYTDDVPKYNYDPEKARKLLDEAGYPERGGVRFHLTMKTSTEESTRLLAAVLQQQLRAVGIVLDIRSFEFATFYSDVVKGSFQLYSLRWIGGNEDPDIYEHVFESTSTPPKRANRSYYANPRVDELIHQGRATLEKQARKQIYAEVQRLIAEDQPYINLWYLDNVLVHTRRLRNIEMSSSGNYDFLKVAELWQEVRQ